MNTGTTSRDRADWFERITGFAEGSYEWTQARLRVSVDCLVSTKDGTRHRFGRFEMVSLGELLDMSPAGVEGTLSVKTVTGDARALHADSRNAGATFQVASQFNALEMVGPDVTPESGVTRYEFDRTQGPACAIAASGATIWRNYLAPVAGGIGQRSDRQLDGLHDLGLVLANALERQVDQLWSMRNGYAMCSDDGLRRIAALLKDCDQAERTRLRNLLRMGWHRNVDVTDMEVGSRHQVNQVFCSALPVAYGRHSAALWEPFARLVLEAAYEATLRCAWITACAGGSNRVLLTGLGGGAFGNRSDWISDALDYALNCVKGTDLDVYLVCYGHVPEHFRRFAQ